MVNASLDRERRTGKTIPGKEAACSEYAKMEIYLLYDLNGSLVWFVNYNSVCVFLSQ